MTCNGQNFLSFWTIFCPFTSPPLTTQKVKILKKWKKTPRDIIILHICTINDNHIMYSSWVMKRDRPNFFVILDRILPFYPTNNPKNQNFGKMKKKKTGDIIILHMYTINDNRIMYGSWDMKNDGHDWTVFCHFTPLTTRKIKILKNWKKCLEILSFYTCVP